MDRSRCGPLLAAHQANQAGTPFRLLDVEQGLRGLVEYETQRDEHNPGQHVVDRTVVVRHLRELIQAAIKVLDDLPAFGTSQLHRRAHALLTVRVQEPDHHRSA